MIAGLEEVSEGEVLIGDEVMNDIAPAHRGVSMVFQSYALYPHMTVAENMGYGLKVNKVPKEEIRRRGGDGGENPATGTSAGQKTEAAFWRPAPARRHWPRHRAQPTGIYVR